MTPKIYYIYKFTGNPDPVATCEKLKKIFGEGYIFDEAHPDAGKMTREEIRQLFTKEMTDGGFTKVIADVSLGLGRFMKDGTTKVFEALKRNKERFAA
tara:strand:- start:25 stop:318 length:294 start_codon:yes stop_codon:yes gene_type:complete